jgi:DNA primase
LEIFVAQQLDLRILTLPHDADPCDFIAAHGGAAFREQLAGAVDAIEHRIRLATEGMVATSETHRANIAIEQILSTLANAQRGGRTTPAAMMLRQQQVLARLAREFHVSEEHLRARLAELRRGKTKPTLASLPAGGQNRSDTATPTGGRPLPKLPAWERELLELLLTAPDVIERLADDVVPDDIRHPLARSIYLYCLELEHDGRAVDIDSLMLRCDDLESKSLLVQLDEEARAKRQSDLAQRVRDVVQAIHRRRTQEQVHRQLATLAGGRLSQQQEEETLYTLFNQLRDRQAGSAPTDG